MSSQNNQEEFEVIERAFDRSIDNASSESTRIGSLVAGQIAVAAVLAEKLVEFFPQGLIGFLALVGVSVIWYGIICYVRPVARKVPYATEKSLETNIGLAKNLLPENIKTNERAASIRKKSFITLLALSVIMLIWTVVAVTPKLMMDKSISDTEATNLFYESLISNSSDTSEATKDDSGVNTETEKSLEKIENAPPEIVNCWYSEKQAEQMQQEEKIEREYPNVLEAYFQIVNKKNAPIGKPVKITESEKSSKPLDNWDDEKYLGRCYYVHN